MSQGMATLGVTYPRMVSGSLKPDSRVPMSTLQSQGPGPGSQPTMLMQASRPAGSTGLSPGTSRVSTPLSPSSLSCGRAPTVPNSQTRPGHSMQARERESFSQPPLSPHPGCCPQAQG